MIFFFFEGARELFFHKLHIVRTDPQKVHRGEARKMWIFCGRMMLSEADMSISSNQID